MADRDWAALPNHILGLILNRLPFPDLIKSRVVCKSWRLAEVDPSKPWAPMLMLAGDPPTDKNSEYRTLFCLSGRKSYRLHLPQLRRQRVLGSADSWLVTVDNDTADGLQLFNPFTRAVHALPSITTLSAITAVERYPLDGRIKAYTYHPDMRHSPKLYHLDTMLFSFHKRAVIFPSISDPSSTLVFLIYGGGSDRYMAFARVADERWTEFPNSTHHFSDVVLHKGQFCALATSVDRGLCYVNIDASPSPSSPRLLIKSKPNQHIDTDRIYLVESLHGAELLHIERYEWHGSHNRMTRCFVVFKLNESGEKISVESLEEGTALFLGDNRTMMLTTKNSPELQDNCIYFTGETDGYRHKQGMECDVGVFDMKTRRVRPLYPHESPLNLLTWPQPFWLTPCLP